MVLNFCLIGKFRHNFLVPRMIESAPKTFMPIQTPDLDRVYCWLFFIILTNFKDIYNLTQFSKTFIRWKKVIKILVTNLWRFPLRLHRDFSIMYNQKFWVGLHTASGNLIFQVDKSVPFFLFHVEKSCLWLEFLSEIVTRRQPKKLNGHQISWLWPEQVSVHLVGFLIFELLVSMPTVMNFCGSD